MDETYKGKIKKYDEDIVKLQKDKEAITIQFNEFKQA